MLAGTPAGACDRERASVAAARAAARRAERTVRQAAAELRAAIAAERAAADSTRTSATDVSERSDQVREVSEAARAASREGRDAAIEASRESMREHAAALREAAREIVHARAKCATSADGYSYAYGFANGHEASHEWSGWADMAGARPLRHATITDTVMRVGPGVTFALANLAGDISVQAWDRNEVRIHVEHDRDDRVATELRNGVLKVRVRPGQEDAAEAEWVITVPAWLPLDLSGMEGDIVVSGMRSHVRAQTVRGDVLVHACQGQTEVNSVEGEVHVMDVSGNVSAVSVNNVIRIVRVTGPVDAQTINGDIQLEKLASPSVDASTVNGRVYYASPFQPRGRYAFSSHNGKLFVGVPSDQAVNVKLSSFQGQIESSLPVPETPDASEPGARVLRFRRGRTLRFTTGETPEPPQAPEPASAPRQPRVPVIAPQAPELELESFGGLIQLASQEEVLRAIDRQRSLLDSRRAVSLARRGVERVRRLGRAPQAMAVPAPGAPQPPPPPPNR